MPNIIKGSSTMLVTNPHIILNIETFILPTAWNTFSNEIPITDTIANVNTTSEYCNAKLIVYSLDENILRKPGIPKRHNIVSTIPCITLSPIPIVVALCALFFSLAPK